MDVDRFLRSLEIHALPRNGRGECAKHVRQALEEAGVDTTGHPICAKDWGPMLARIGFAAWTVVDYHPARGDIVVFHAVPGAPMGHIQAFDGSRWISDCVQMNGFWPGPAYRTDAARFMPYRHESVDGSHEAAMYQRRARPRDAEVAGTCSR